MSVVADALAIFKAAADRPTLKGKLYLSKSGFLLLSVPNAVGRGAFKALHEAGVELPPSTNGEGYNAHITVARDTEVEQIGASKITERGRDFSYSLGQIKDFNPSGWAEMNRCWVIQVKSPELEKLRRSYGLPALPTKPDGTAMQFHCTFAVRRSGVLGSNEKSKVQDSERKPIKITDTPGVQLKKAAKHILISGYSGSGKSTLGRQLALARAMPFLEVDKDPEMQDFFRYQRARQGSNLPFMSPEDPVAMEKVRSIVERMLAKEEPHVIEGVQLALAPLASTEGHERILVDKSPLAIIRQRLRRTRMKNEDGPLPPGSRAARFRASQGRSYIDSMRPAVERYSTVAEKQKPRKPTEEEEHAQIIDQFALKGRKWNPPAGVIKVANEDGAPWRERAEMFAMHPGGQVYGGVGYR
jgi:hypothetical protein